MDRQDIRVGTAGWSIPGPHADRFALGASHLERYASRFSAVEIDTSFYKPHRPATYARWAATTPEGFRFAVKTPRVLTHIRRLDNPGEPLDHFMEEVGELGAKLGPLLVQLPPSLVFNPAKAEPFWREVRARFIGDVVCEPRHRSWFTGAADEMLRTWKVAQAAADPPPVPGADEPAGWSGLRYIRLHGSPRMYYDAYSEEYLDHLAERLMKFAQDAPVWCIFDNTAEGEAVANALGLLDRLRTENAVP